MEYFLKMSKQLKQVFTHFVLIMILQAIFSVLINHSKIYADQCDAFTDVIIIEKKKDLMNSDIDVIKYDNLTEAESFFETEFGRPYDKKICAIYLAKSYYYYKEMDKAKKYINMAFNNIINMYDEKCSEIFYYKLLIDPDQNSNRTYEKLRNRSPELTEKFDQIMHYNENQIMQYLSFPWNNQPPVVHEYLAQKDKTLYVTINHVSHQIDRFNQIYNEGKEWVQTEDNVNKLYKILIDLKKVQEIKDSETMERYKSFIALKRYYERKSQ